MRPLLSRNRRVGHTGWSTILLAVGTPVSPVEAGRGQVDCRPNLALRNCVDGASLDGRVGGRVIISGHWRGAPRGFLGDISLLVLGCMARTSLATIRFPLGPVIRLTGNQRLQGYLIHCLIHISAITSSYLQDRFPSPVYNLVSPDTILCSPEMCSIAG